MRFRWRTVGWIVATLFATYVLLPQIGRLGRTTADLQEARLPWFAAALTMSVVTYAAAALAVMGASPRPLAFGRTMKVQLATSFANLLLPYGLGATAVNEKYLERSRVPPATAVAVVAVVASTGMAMHIIELVGVGLWLGSTRQLVHAASPSGRDLLIGIVAVIALLAVFVAILLRRPRLLSEVGNAARSMIDILRQPRRAVLLFGGQLCTNIAYIAALGFALQAFGEHTSPARLAAAYLAGAALGAAGPTPAGLGVVEASLVAGLTVVGVPGAPAVAGVLTFRLATFWLPAAAGFFSFRSLQRSRIL